MKSISVPFRKESIAEAGTYIKECLTSYGVKNTQLKETLLISEELMIKILNTEENKNHEDDLIDISVRRNPFGRVVSFVYDGKLLRYSVQDDDIDAGARILKHYNNRISYRYGAGRNQLSVIANNTYARFINSSVLSIMLAIMASLVLLETAPQEVISYSESIITSIVGVYCKILCLVAPIVTFFSIIKVISQIAKTAVSFAWIRRLIGDIFKTSFVAVVFGGLIAYLLYSYLQGRPGAFSKMVQDTTLGNSLTDMLRNMLPDSILEVFTGENSLLLIIVAVICGVAIASVGSGTTILDDMMLALYTFISRILSMLYSITPILLFPTVMFLILKTSIAILLRVVLVLFAFLLGMMLLSLLYYLIVKFNGLNTKYLNSVIKTNAMNILYIGSALEAVPYVNRICARRLHISSDLLDESLPLMAQLNMDGNCFVVSMISFFYLFIRPTVQTQPIELLILIAVIIIFCTGAPSQPGSIVITMTVLSPLIGVFSETLPIMLLIDVLTGSIIAMSCSISSMCLASVEAYKEGYIDKNFKKLR